MRSSPRQLAGFLAAVAAAAPPLPAAESTGAIEGRVVNAATGEFLHNARVAAGGRLAAQTDDNGAFRLAGLPAGDAVLAVSFTGFAPQTSTVRVSAGAIVRRDFELQLAAAGAAQTVRLAAFTVEARRLTAEAVALQERRLAPNIKDVVALEEFPHFGEGGVGEYLQFLPGLNLSYNPQSPVAAAIRGMPPGGTLVTMDGAILATGGGTGNTTRQHDFAVALNTNIDRIEITKTPTPDLPANAVGGSINLISKSAFSRRTPLLTARAFATFTAPGGWEHTGRFLGQSDGPDRRTDIARLRPALEASYLRPLGRTLALTFSGSLSSRYDDWLILRRTWDKVRGVQTTHSMTALPKREDKESLQLGAEWRPQPRSHFRLNATYAMQKNSVRQNSLIANTGAGASGGPDFSLGAPAGVGSVQLGAGWNNQYKPSRQLAFAYKFSGDRWQADTSASWSAAVLDIRDHSEGFINNLSSNLGNLIVRTGKIDRIEEGRVGLVTATDRTGAPVNIRDSAIFPINSVTSNPTRIGSEAWAVAFNARRAFAGPLPFALKAGAAINESYSEKDAGTRTWNFNPPGGAAGRLAGNYDLIAQGFSDRGSFTDADGRAVAIRTLSMAKLHELFKAQPDWFALNEAAAHTSAAQLTNRITERVTAGYLRGDVRALGNKLWLVGGVRYELTEDDGRGLRSDLGAAFVRDAAGRLVRNAAGAVIPLTNDPLARAQLQYQRLGARTQRDYDGFYPSLNASYALAEHVVIRAAWARTIGRPDFNEVIPGLNVTDPAAPPGNRTITVVTGALQPWIADNYDLTLEAYGVKSTVATLSGFRKDVRDFFAQTRLPVTAADLAELGLPDDYLDYDLITKRNAGQASVEGIELGVKHAFACLPRWARGLGVFANVTHLALDGPNARDFSRFCPRIINWGASLVRPNFNIRIAVMDKKWERVGAVASSATVRPGSYDTFAPQRKIDLSAEFRVARRCSVEASVRNLTGEGLVRGTWSPDTPGHARIDQVQFTGALFTLGVKGEF